MVAGFEFVVDLGLRGAMRRFKEDREEVLLLYSRDSLKGTLIEEGVDNSIVAYSNTESKTQTEGGGSDCKWFVSRVHSRRAKADRLCTTTTTNKENHDHQSSGC